MGSNGCDSYDPDLGENHRLDRLDFCPAMSQIQWGSIDNWNSAPICVDDGNRTQEPIRFCAFTSGNDVITNPIYDATDFAISFYYTVADEYRPIESFDDYTVTVANQRNMSADDVRGRPC